MCCLCSHAPGHARPGLQRAHCAREWGAVSWQAAGLGFPCAALPCADYRLVWASLVRHSLGWARCARSPSVMPSLDLWCAHCARTPPVMPDLGYSVPTALANGRGAVSWLTPPWARAFVRSPHGRVFPQTWSSIYLYIALYSLEKRYLVARPFLYIYLLPPGNISGATSQAWIRLLDDQACQ